MEGIKIKVVPRNFSNEMLIAPIRVLGDSTSEVSVPVGGNWEVCRVDRGGMPPEVEAKILRLPVEWARQLHEELGKHFAPVVNPTAERLKATEYHLEDMRRIVFESVLKRGA